MRNSKAITVLSALFLAAGCNAIAGIGDHDLAPQADAGSSGIGGDTAAMGGGTNGGTSGSAHGGATSGGGSSASGGSATSGGTYATAGTTANGGASAAGGAVSSGGVTSNGGAAASGGAAHGGATASGGTNSNGGSAASGGTGGRGGSGGAVASGGTGGATATKAPCTFANGLNVAWVSFANDIPNPDITTFNTIFTNTAGSGGRVARWWFHTNGTTTPGYDANGKAKAIQQLHIDGVKQILKAANSAGLGLIISLWSFDMLQSSASAIHTYNSALLEDDTSRQAYIDNYLTPLVTGLKGTPGLYAYEIFSEPEGMGPNGWTTYRTTEAAIQTTVNWFSAAIHAADPNVLVTNAATTFDTCATGVAGKVNDYSDAALLAAGTRTGGTLDFYEVHYYSSNGVSNSPFKQTASHWGLDKKIVLGELSPVATDGVAADALETTLFQSGYAGGWLWANTDPSTGWPAEKAPLTAMFSAHASEVNSCPPK
jgi:Cellulase (glycosyl hydrolase family 5)